MPKDAPADAGSNLTRETFSQHYAAWMDAKRLREAAVAKERAALKAAENAGINIKAMKANERDRLLGEDAVRSYERDRAKQAMWMGLPLHTQTSLFGDHLPPDATPAEEISAAFARDAGWQSGKAGGSRVEDNPFKAGTLQHVEWDKGYMDGQRAIADGMKPKTKKEAAPEPADRKPRNRGKRVH